VSKFETLDNQALCHLTKIHCVALESAATVFEFTVAKAMGTDSQSNHEGFSRWAASNTAAVKGWREIPALRSTLIDLRTELERRKLL
jgi:hypothetical protein